MYQSRGFGFAKPSPQTHLQHAREELVEDLPEDHAFLNRVRLENHGELLPNQPAGRPRITLSRPPTRKRGKQPDDPSNLIERQRLMVMWNEKWDLKDDWNRAREKMAENYKNLGMREKPYPPSNNLSSSAEKMLDSSSEEDSEAAINQPTKKKRKSRVDEFEEDTVLFRGRQTKGDSPRPKVKRQVRGSSQGPSPLSQHSDGTDIPKSSDTDTDGLFQLPLTQRVHRHGLLDSIESDFATVHSYLPFPSVEQLLSVIPPTGTTLDDMRELFWERVSSDVHKFFCLLESNTNLNQETGAIFKKRAGRKEESLDVFDTAMNTANSAGSQGKSRSSWIKDVGNGTDGKVWHAESLLPSASSHESGDIGESRLVETVTSIDTETKRFCGRRLARQGALGKRWDDQGVSPTHRKCKTSPDNILL